MKQDVAGYFVKMDGFGKSEMDYFVEEKMDFGKDEELPIGPAPAKTIKSTKNEAIKTGKNGNVSAKRWAPTKPRAPVKSRVPPSTHVKSAGRQLAKSTRTSASPAKKQSKFVREDMVDEVALLEREELALCRDDDFGMTFDLDL
jgi:hypothetical protein